MAWDELSDSGFSSDEERNGLQAQFADFRFGINDVPDSYDDAQTDAGSLPGDRRPSAAAPRAKETSLGDGAPLPKSAWPRGAVAFLPALRSLPLFVGWTDHDLFVVVDAMSNVRFPEGTSLWQKGQPTGQGARLYILLEGHCAATGLGREARYGPGDVLGSNVFEEKAYSTTLRTLSAVQALALSKRAYQRVLYRVQTQKQDLFIHCLGQTALAKYLPTSRFLDLIDALEEKWYQPKQSLLVEDKACPVLRVVIQGSVRITQKAGGYPAEVGCTQGLCVLGEAEFFTGAIAAVGCQAATELHVAELHRPQFDLLVGDAPTFFADALLEGAPAAAFQPEPPEPEGRVWTWGERPTGVASVVEIVPYVDRQWEQPQPAPNTPEPDPIPEPEPNPLTDALVLQGALRGMVDSLVEGCLTFLAARPPGPSGLLSPPPLAALHRMGTAPVLSRSALRLDPDCWDYCVNSRELLSEGPITPPFPSVPSRRCSSHRHLKPLPHLTLPSPQADLGTVARQFPPGLLRSPLTPPARLPNSEGSSPLEGKAEPDFPSLDLKPPPQLVLRIPIVPNSCGLEPPGEGMASPSNGAPRKPHFVSRMTELRNWAKSQAMA